MKLHELELVDPARNECDPCQPMIMTRPSNESETSLPVVTGKENNHKQPAPILLFKRRQPPFNRPEVWGRSSITTQEPMELRPELVQALGDLTSDSPEGLQPVLVGNLEELSNGHLLLRAKSSSQVPLSWPSSQGVPTPSVLGVSHSIAHLGAVSE